MRSTPCLALIVATLTLAACGGDEPTPKPPPPPPPVSAAPPVASTPPPADTTPPPPAKPTLAELMGRTMQAMGDAFNAHDATKFAANFAPDAAGSYYGAMDWNGRDDIVKNVGGFMAMSSDVKSAPTRIWTKGNVAIIELASKGTMTGDFMGMKATNKPFGGMRLIVAWFNDDGLVKATHEYADGAGMMAQCRGKKDAPPIPALPAGPPEMHVAKSTPDEDKLADWMKWLDSAFDKDSSAEVAATMIDDADYWLNFTGTATIDCTQNSPGALSKTVTCAAGVDGGGQGIDGNTVGTANCTN